MINLNPKISISPEFSIDPIMNIATNGKNTDDILKINWYLDMLASIKSADIINHIAGW